MTKRNIVVQGSKSFDNYATFKRAMGVALSDMQKGDVIVVYGVGAHKTNAFVSEFSNIAEVGMKARGMKIMHRRVTTSWVEENDDLIDYFIYLCQPDERPSALAKSFDSKCDVGIFKY